MLTSLALARIKPNRIKLAGKTTSKMVLSSTRIFEKVTLSFPPRSSSYLPPPVRNEAKKVDLVGNGNSVIYLTLVSCGVFVVAFIIFLLACKMYRIFIRSERRINSFFRYYDGRIYTGLRRR